MKTRVIILNDVSQTNVKKGDTGYIDGYVRADNRPWAVFVRESDGEIDFVNLNSIKAILKEKAE